MFSIHIWISKNWKNLNLFSVFLLVKCCDKLLLTCFSFLKEKNINWNGQFDGNSLFYTILTNLSFNIGLYFFLHFC